MPDFESHLTRQIAFSRATFGPDERTAGVTDHIRKELQEVARALRADQRAREWVDVVILGLDGLWRAVQANEVWLTSDEVAQIAVGLIVEKQGRNELRDWPDWRTADPNKAIEHDRSGE